MDDCLNKNNPNTNSKSEIKKLLILNFFQNQRYCVGIYNFIKIDA